MPNHIRLYNYNYIEMKKIQLILILLICTKAGIGQQLILTGTIIGTGKKDSVEENESYLGNYGGA
jgi:hypothetical protein